MAVTFFHELKKEPPKQLKRATMRGHVPIASMNKLGCSVCPRNDDPDLLHPKMPASGNGTPLVYLLGTGPNADEDETGRHWMGAAGKAITSMFDRSFYSRHLRSNHITQCMPAIGGPGHPGQPEIECCRGRIVKDIEETKPLVIVGVGDEPLAWATGLPRNALAFRGTLIATKIGNHVCWYFPILYPNYLS